MDGTRPAAARRTGGNPFPNGLGPSTGPCTGSVVRPHDRQCRDPGVPSASVARGRPRGRPFGGPTKRVRPRHGPAVFTGPGPETTPTGASVCPCRASRLAPSESTVPAGHVAYSRGRSARGSRGRDGDDAGERHRSRRPVARDGSAVRPAWSIHPGRRPSPPRGTPDRAAGASPRERRSDRFRW